MNGGSGIHARWRPWRAGILAAAVSVALISGCSGSSGGSGGSPGGSGVSSAAGGSTSAGDSAAGGSSATGGSSFYEEELAFAQCMQSRGQGVPDPPDNGSSFIVGDPGHGTGTPQFLAAEKACQHLLPNGGQPSQAEQEQSLLRMLKYADCMRTHGVTDFPEPPGNVGSGMNSRSRGYQPVGNLDPSSGQFQKAQQACQSILSSQGG
jgi:hypothetical protein